MEQLEPVDVAALRVIVQNNSLPDVLRVIASIVREMALQRSPTSVERFIDHARSVLLLRAANTMQYTVVPRRTQSKSLH